MLDFKAQDIPSCSVLECLNLLQVHPEILLLDVRRTDEYIQFSILESTHLELAEILDGQWQSLLPYKDKGLILYCRSGVRSLKAAQYLANQGFTKLWNMTGGILAYQQLQLNS